jgi:tetraacyldisaccharide 4'-kinase
LKTKGIYFLYRVLQALALPALLAYFLLRSFRNPAYFTSLRQRLGFLSRHFNQTVPGAIWLHAVSVGEVLAIVELARRMRADFPRNPIFVSTGTLAGRAAARDKLAGIASGIFYAPIDHVFAVRRVLRTIRPALVAIVETEIWPNLFREAKRAGCGLVIVNGRISDRTHARYRRHRWFFCHVMQWPDAVLVQSEAMRERFLAMGTPAARVQIGGNLKYDFTPKELAADSPVRQFLERMQPAEVWIAASTMPPARSGDIDEDDIVIPAFRKLAEQHPGLLLVLAPRRPERFPVVAEKLARAAVPFLKRSELDGTLALPGVLLLDSIGELGGLFAFADAVFMGGTLAERGGHNILEPTFYSCPIVCGPHLENFREIAEDFRAAEAMVEIPGPAELTSAVERILSDRRFAAELGRRALACAESKKGATGRAVDAIRDISADSWPCFRPVLPLFAILWPLAQLWRIAGAWKRRRDHRRRRRMEAGVVSVGNISMGGTGKTPLVVYLATQMVAAGHRPGILSRGYGRHSLDRNLILEPESQASVAQTGDEPQIFARAGVAPVGIGASRFETGWLLEQQFNVDVLLLDDGFQHVRLNRQVDIVLIDGILPFAGGDVFPLGRLREPLTSLARADAIVITRAECCRSPEGLARRLRRYNERARIFHARSIPEYWVEVTGKRTIPARELPFTRVAAFCGLGNPHSFWCTLDLLGIAVEDRVEFNDHHSYRPRELRRLTAQFAGARAEAALTTEKDAINLCASCDELMAPLEVYWLKIGTAVDREAELLAFIESRLPHRVPRVSTALRSDSPTP